MKKKIYVSMMGGIGDQIFQFAFANFLKKWKMRFVWIFPITTISQITINLNLELKIYLKKTNY